MPAMNNVLLVHTPPGMQSVMVVGMPTQTGGIAGSGQGAEVAVTVLVV